MKSIFLFVVLSLLLFFNGIAQDDLMKMIDTTSSSSQPVVATFSTTRIINAHSNETVKSHTLDFRITHRFGDIGGSEGNFHNFYGVYNIRDVRIAFEYGISNRLTIALAKDKWNEFFDGYIKYRVMQQTTDDKVPFGVTLFANAAYSPMKASTDNTSEFSYKNESQRLSYTAQAIIARKFGTILSLAILPTFVYRNYVAFADENGIFSVGIGGRLKLASNYALIADYFYIPSNNKRTDAFQSVDPTHPAFYNPLAVGLEVETGGGHVFSITFTNSEAIIENAFIPSTTKSWSKGEFRWGFNISRVFTIG